MSDWNQQAAPNNNLNAKTILSSEQMVGRKGKHNFSEELSDGGERDQIIQKLKEKNK